MFLLLCIISALLGAITAERGVDLWLTFNTWLSLAVMFLGIHFLVPWLSQRSWK